MKHLITALLVAALGLALGGGTAAAKKKAPAGRYWRAKSSGIRLSKQVRVKLDAIGERYHDKTRRTLVVTSGTRTPREQASAMYKKLRAGSRLRIYKNDAAIAPLRKTYDLGRRKRWSRKRIVDKMASIIQGQCDRGVYISRHLRANAFDVRSRGLSRKQKRAFRAAVKHVGGVKVIEESRPPHFHLELR